jgi:predicted transcriptional regulator
MQSHSFHIDPRLLSKYEDLAQSMGRDRDSLIREALENYIDAQAWQVEEILRAIQEADRGDYASNEAVRRTVRKWTSRMK